MARRSRSETSSDLILKTCASFPPPRPPPLRDVIWRVFSRLHLLAIRTACRACRAEVADEGWTAAPHPAPQSATECNIETTFEITEMGGTAASPSAKARVAPRPPRRQRCPGAAPCNNLDVFSRLRKSDHASCGGEAGRSPLVDLQDRNGRTAAGRLRIPRPLPGDRLRRPGGHAQATGATLAPASENGNRRHT